MASGSTGTRRRTPDERRERGRWREGHDRLERQRGAMCEGAVGNGRVAARTVSFGGAVPGAALADDGPRGLPVPGRRGRIVGFPPCCRTNLAMTIGNHLETFAGFPVRD